MKKAIATAALLLMFNGQWSMANGPLGPKGRFQSIAEKERSMKTSGNPIFEGWYADPEAVVFGKTCWIFPTFSAEYENQLHFDAFSSKDLVTWTKHPNVLTSDSIRWARMAMWAPSVIEKELIMDDSSMINKVSVWRLGLRLKADISPAFFCR